MHRILILSLALLMVGAASTDFDGTNDHINYGDIPALDDATTISHLSWVYQDNITQDHFVFGQWNPGTMIFCDDAVFGESATDAFGARVQELGGGDSEANILGTTGTCKQNIWQRVALTVQTGSSTGAKLYIDGSEDSTSPSNTTALANLGTQSKEFWSGERNNSSLDRNGQIGPIQAWTRVLSLTELEEASWKPGMIPNSLVLFDPGWDGGSTHTDLSSNGNTGSVVGATNSDNGPPVMFGGGLPL